MKRIAIYGKGGIGKSTISSNISAAMGALGYSIIQIGCDPKHDSTQALTQSTKTLLETICQDNVEKYKDIVKRGSFGVYCVEIGGPKPGIGCAGRGIIKGIQILNELEIFEKYDIQYCLYDVLGDVVCGGFFEPLRAGKADELYLVTSGEFNSLFAANNICAGYLNSINGKGKVKLGGIIGNLRDGIYERELIEEFSKKVNIPIIAMIPRDARIEHSTIACRPIGELYPGSDIQVLFEKLAQRIFLNDAVDRVVKALRYDELKELYWGYVDK